MNLSTSIADIDDYRIQYPKKSPEDFDSLVEYIEVAQKLIKKHCFPSLRNSLLSSEDAVSYFAEKLMLADWRWQPIYKGRPISKRAYRKKCFKWAVNKFIQSSVNKKNVQHYPLNDNTGVDTKIFNDTIMADETNRRKVDFLLQNSDLSERQRQCVEMYYLKELNFPQISRELNISKQAVQQNVSRGLTTMGWIAGVNQKEN